MTNLLKALRDELAAALAPSDLAYPAHPAVPDAIEPPCLVIQPADDYLSDAQTFGEPYSVALDVFCFVPLQSNGQAADDLDAMVAHVATHLPGGWGLDKVGRPGPFAVGEHVFHALPITVSTYTHL